MWERKHISHVRCVWCYACTQSALDDCDGIYMETLDLYSCIYFLWSQQLYGCGGIFYLVHRADTNPLIFTALLQQIHLNPFSSNTLKGPIWRKSNVSHTLCSYTHRWRERLLMENMACNKKSSILIHLRCKIGGMGGGRGWGWTRLWILGPVAKLLRHLRAFMAWGGEIHTSRCISYTLVSHTAAVSPHTSQYLWEILTNQHQIGQSCLFFSNLLSLQRMTTSHLSPERHVISIPVLLLKVLIYARCFMVEWSVQKV